MLFKFHANLPAKPTLIRDQANSVRVNKIPVYGDDNITVAKLEARKLNKMFQLYKGNRLMVFKWNIHLQLMMSFCFSCYDLLMSNAWSNRRYQLLSLLLMVVLFCISLSFSCSAFCFAHFCSRIHWNVPLCSHPT